MSTMNYGTITRWNLIRRASADPLPSDQDGLPRYERDIAVRSYVVPHRGQTPQFDRATQRDILSTGMYGHVWSREIHVSTVEGEELLVPTFEIASNPSISLADIRDRRFHIVDRAQVVQHAPEIGVLIFRPTKRNWSIGRYRLVTRAR